MRWDLHAHATGRTLSIHSYDEFITCRCCLARTCCPGLPLLPPPPMQCFTGPHLSIAIAGAVLLAVFGILLPLVLGALLWLNRSRLQEPAFSAKVCWGVYVRVGGEHSHAWCRGLAVNKGQLV